MAWDWQVFCKTTDDATVMATCMGKGGDITYLQWMLQAWGWTLSVAACAWVIAVVLGGLVGTLRTLPNSPWPYAVSASEIVECYERCARIARASPTLKEKPRQSNSPGRGFVSPAADYFFR